MIAFPAQQSFYIKITRIKDAEFANQIIVNAAESYGKLKILYKNYKIGHKKIIFQRLLPLFCIYQSLLDNNIDKKEAIHVVEILLRETFFSTQLSGIRLLNQILPDPFPVIKPALRYMTRFSDLPSGQEIKLDDENCFAINVYQCFIHDTLIELEAPELTPVFCASDDWLSEAMPKVEWRRTQTLGRGGEMCDFCWCRKK
jgi:hypothetical protein